MKMWNGIHFFVYHATLFYVVTNLTICFDIIYYRGNIMKTELNKTLKYTSYNLHTFIIDCLQREKREGT